MGYIEFDAAEMNNLRWKKIMSKQLKMAKTFEIHCWNEEQKEIKMVLPFGELKESCWKYGKIIHGPVTPEFIEYILSLPKPTDTEIYNKMTPFFTIALDNGFWSEHYGTELTKE